MPLKLIDKIAIPAAQGSAFDHGAFDAKTRRVFVAHTGHNCVEVIDHDTRKHVATLQGFPEVAGVVADDGQVLVTNRGSATLAWIDAASLETRSVFGTGFRPNGAAIAARQGLAIAACIGDETHASELQCIDLRGGKRTSLDLPGQPRWCVMDADARRVFLAIREPSMILVARLPDLGDVQHWKLPVAGAHGLDINHRDGRLYVACDDAAVVEVDASSGEVMNRWPIAGAPDVTFFNPSTNAVHVAIGKPGLIQSIDLRTNTSAQTMTSPRAHTTAIVAPDTLYVFSPLAGEALVFQDVKNS